MKDIVNKFIEIEKRTSGEKGSYELFALFLREDSFDKWDVLVAANWINKDKEGSLRYLGSIIQTTFSPSELLFISRIVIIEENNPFLDSVQMMFRIEHNSVEVKNSEFFGLQIKHAYFITSKNGIAA